MLLGISCMFTAVIVEWSEKSKDGGFLGLKINDGPAEQKNQRIVGRSWIMKVLRDVQKEREELHR